MPEKSVAEKLQIRTGRSVLFLNPSENARALIGSLPYGVDWVENPTGPVDIVIAFTPTQAELEDILPRVKAYLKSTGMAWLLYYKGTSKKFTGIHRDSINAYAQSLGYDGVAMVSVDSDWSALRLRLREPEENA